MGSVLVYKLDGLLTGRCPRQYEFLRQYSSDPNNVVIGVVRDKSRTEAKISEDVELKTRSNVHILQADLTDYKAMQVSRVLSRTRCSLVAHVDR